MTLEERIELAARARFEEVRASDVSVAPFPDWNSLEEPSKKTWRAGARFVIAAAFPELFDGSHYLAQTTVVPHETHSAYSVYERDSYLNRDKKE